MGATVIDGKALAAATKAEAAEKVKALKAQGINPCLAVIQVGENPASQVYVRGKINDCAQCGIESRSINLPADTTQDALLAELSALDRVPLPRAENIAMPRREPVRKVEHFDTTQAKLCMLFTTGEANPNPPSVSILRVAMSVLGGSATSRLFRNVREKQSLCYYCGSAAQRATGVMMIDSGVEPGKEQQAEAAIIAELEGLKNGPITQEEVDDCRRGLLSSMDALGDSLAALENWYYGQITRGEPLYPPEYGKVLTSAVSLDEVRQTLQSYSYSVCYAVTAEPGTQGKGGSEDVE